MSLKEIADILINAKRPIDVFGYVSEEEIKKQYKKYIKICHPDIVGDKYKKLAQETSSSLNKFYEKALEEIKKGTYGITDEKELLKTNKPIFEFEIKGKKYEFYKYLSSDDVCDIYEGILDDELVVLKIVMDESDNDLLLNEYDTLSKLDHLSIPKVLTRAKINGREALIFYKAKGLTIKELKKEYGYLSGSHVAWVLERLLSVVGYLHSNMIVHGNIKEENVIIDVENHNVVLLDYSLCINKANESDSKYKIINKYYSPSYVSNSSRVIPNADIYAVGKIAINLLGGDIENVALPLSCNENLRVFIRKLLKSDENDAWKLWNELIEIRNKVYGTKRFQILNKRK